MKQVMHHGQIGIRKDKNIIVCVVDLAGLTDDLGNDCDSSYDFWTKLSHQSSEMSPNRAVSAKLLPGNYQGVTHIGCMPSLIENCIAKKRT